MAGLFRSSRVTLLLGEEGAGKSTLLRSGVLPIMDRRARNLASATMVGQRAEVPGASPSPDRREAPTHERYATVFFDRWDEAPLLGLRAAIDDAARLLAANPVAPSLTLADALIALSKQGSVRFLIVLDRFEAFLAAAKSSATCAFTDQLVAALNTPFLPANFLISIRDDAEPLLEPLAERVPGLGDARLRVLPIRRAPERSAWGDQAISPAERGESLISKAFGSPTVDFDIAAGPADSAIPLEANHAADPKAIADASEMSPGQTGATESVASVDAQQAPDHAESIGSSDATPAARLADGLADGLADRLVFPAFDAADAPPPARGAPARRRWRWLAAAIAAGVVLFVVVANRPDENAPKQASSSSTTAPPDAAGASSAPTVSNDAAALSHGSAPPAAAESASVAGSPAVSAPAIESPVAAAPIPAPESAPAPAGLPSKIDFTLAVDVDNGTATRIAHDLAKAVVRDGLVIDVRATSDPTAELVAEIRDEPRLVIARRDVMDAARRSNGDATATKAARILMPLFAEQLYFIVRVDSPLRYVHQIENKRINIGGANDARAATAKNVYQAMFGKAIPAAAASAFDVRQALNSLTRDHSIDAIILVATQPAAFLTSMAPAMRQRIKLLKLDAGDPAERRALRTYLSSTLREDANRVLPYENIQTLAVTSFLLASPPTDPAGAARLEALANSLCRNLPGLRRTGDPHWREVGSGAALNIEWPDAGVAAANLRTCVKRNTAEPRRKRTMRRR